jgi:Zn-finger nucleic acid-binding protein
MSDRQGIEIDYCPKCRGIWLDRGELDKLLDRAAGDSDVRRQAQSMPRDDDERRRDNDDSKYGYKYQHPHKKKSWLAEIFD